MCVLNVVSWFQVYEELEAIGAASAESRARRILAVGSERGESEGERGREEEEREERGRGREREGERERERGRQREGERRRERERV